MSIRPDVWIKRLAIEHAMIEPFVETQVRQREGRSVVSYGLSSFGYDIRVSRHFRIFTNVYGSVVDPKAFDARGLVEIDSDVCLIPPNSFALALSVETFRIPDNVMTLCVGKSTYARCGIIVNVTPFEPGWEGQAVLEISIRPPCRQRSTPTRAWPRSCSSSRRLPATSPTPSERASTSTRVVSRCRRCRAGPANAPPWRPRAGTRPSSIHPLLWIGGMPLPVEGSPW